MQFLCDIVPLAKVCARSDLELKLKEALKKVYFLYYKFIHFQLTAEKWKH